MTIKAKYCGKWKGRERKGRGETRVENSNTEELKKEREVSKKTERFTQ
jgi:hypothetical protein